MVYDGVSKQQLAAVSWSDPAYPDLSARDADAVKFWDQTHA